MKKFSKIVLITAGVCVIVGGGLVVAGYAMGGTSGFMINRSGIYTNHSTQEGQRAGQKAVLAKTEIQSFQNMDIHVGSGDVELIASDGYYLEYSLNYHVTEPSYRVENGSLIMDTRENLISGGFINFNFGMQETEGYLKIYLPENVWLETVKLTVSDGDISGGHIKVGNAEITDSYGNLKLESWTADQMTVKSSDGHIELIDSSASELNITNSYGKTKLTGIKGETIVVNASDGDISLEDVNGTALSLENSYGNVLGSRVKSDKLIIKQSDGNCELEELDIMEAELSNAYGKTELKLAGKEADFHFDLSTSDGHVEVNGQLKDDKYQNNSAGARKLKMKSSDGSIIIVTE